MMIYSGTCASHGAFMLNNKSECRKAATELGLKDNMVYETHSSGRPYGCIYERNDFLYWHPLDGSPFLVVSCGSKDLVSSGHYIYDCICHKGKLVKQLTN